MNLSISENSSKIIFICRFGLETAENERPVTFRALLDYLFRAQVCGYECQFRLSALDAKRLVAVLHERDPCCTPARGRHAEIRAVEARATVAAHPDLRFRYVVLDSVSTNSNYELQVR